MIGKNDIYQGKTTSSIIANLTSIYTQILDAGIIVIAMTITPNSTAIPSGSTSTTQIADTYTINNWLRTLPKLYNNFILVDAFQSVVNPSTSLARTNMTRDEIHPSIQGAYYIALEFNKSCTKFLNEVNLFSGGNANPSSIVLNPYLLGNNGSGIPTSWSFYKTSLVTATKVSRDYGL